MPRNTSAKKPQNLVDLAKQFQAEQPQAAPEPSAAAFRRRNNDGEIYTLPGSNLPARIGRPSIMALAAKAGHVPNPLSRAVLLHHALADNAPVTEVEQIEAYTKNAEVYVEVAALALRAPRLILDRAPDYDAGEIGPLDLTDRDYIFVYNTVEGFAEDMAPFRRPAA